MTLEFHEFASAFPLLIGDDFDKLVEDIRANGVQIAIKLYEGKIVDGRNRYRAAKEAGVDCPTEVFEGDAKALVESLNLRRRHLTIGQLAYIAAELATMKPGGDRQSKHSASLRNGTPSQAEAAKLVGVSERSVNSAAFVKKHGTESDKADVQHGKRRVGKVADRIRRRKPIEQPAKKPGPKRSSSACVEDFAHAAAVIEQAIESGGVMLPETMSDSRRVEIISGLEKARAKLTGLIKQLREMTDGSV